MPKAKRTVKNNIARSLMLRVFSFYVFIAISVTLVQMIVEYIQAGKSLRSDLMNYAKAFSTGIATSVWGSDSMQLQSTLEGMLDLPAIAGISVVDKQKEHVLGKFGIVADPSNQLVLITEQGEPQAVNDGGFFTVECPLYFITSAGVNHIGYIDIFSNNSYVFDRVKGNYLFLILNSIVKSFALWIIFLIIANSQLGRPLHILAKRIQKLEKDGFKQFSSLTDEERKLATRSDEIGYFASALFKVLLELQSVNTTMKEYGRSLEEKVEEKVELLKVSQEQLLQTEKNASLSHLAAGLAHEINTPIGIGLTCISEMMERNQRIQERFEKREMTKRDLEDYLAKMQDVGQMIINNLNRTASLVSSFKLVSADQVSSIQRTFFIREYIESVLQSLNPELKKYKATINVYGEKNIAINGYPGPLAQVVTNIIMNSLIHGYDRQPGGRIDIKIDDLGTKVAVVFKDYGQGISKENLNRIFDPFFTTKRGDGGTGLGLSIVFNIIQQTLKGTIQCRSSIGQGVEFKVTIPKQSSPNAA